MDESRQVRINAATTLASSLHSEGAEWDAVMAALRSAGYEMMEAVRATMAVLELSPGAAVGRVIDSPVWADHREATIAANEALRQAAQMLADEWHEDERRWEAVIDLAKDGDGSDRTDDDGWSTMNGSEGLHEREYVGFIWIDDKPGVRLAVQARSLDEARSIVEAEYGAGHTISLWNEKDARRPR